MSTSSSFQTARKFLFVRRVARSSLSIAVSITSVCTFLMSVAFADKPTGAVSTSTPVASTSVNVRSVTPSVTAAVPAASVSKNLSTYEQQIFDAHKAFVAGSAGGAIEGAIDGYRKAIALEPQRPEAHHFLAGALFYKQDFAAAQEAIGNAITRAQGDSKQVNLLGKSLFLSATTKEALNKYDEAKSAWVAYGEFAKSHPDQEMPKEKIVGDAPPMLIKVYPATVVDRINRIEAYAKLVADYAKVKERVLARQKELGVPAPELAKKPTP